MSNRLLEQRDRLEIEIKGLETSLKLKCEELSVVTKANVDADLAMIKRMREILLGTKLYQCVSPITLIALKQEYQEIAASIDRLQPASYYRPVDQLLSGSRAFQGSDSVSFTSGSDLDSLVMRVKEAIGDDPPRSPEFKRVLNSYRPESHHHHHNAYMDSPSDASEGPSGELSLASQQYLQKYGLMPPSPSPVRHSNGPWREPYKPAYSSKLAAYELAEEDVSPVRYNKPKYSRTDKENDGNQILRNIF